MDSPSPAVAHGVVEKVRDCRAQMTLYVVMQLTGRLRWSELFAARPPVTAPTT
jgi:hypothetical protein